MGTGGRRPIPLPSGSGLVLPLPRIRRPAGCRRAGRLADAISALNDSNEPSEAPMERPSALWQAEHTDHAVHTDHAEHAGQAGPEPPRSKGPVVERIAGWSARHRKTALLGWLLLVAGAVMIGNMLGTKNLNSYDPGQSGQAERVLARAAGHAVASDPEIRPVSAATGCRRRPSAWPRAPLSPA